MAEKAGNAAGVAEGRERRLARDRDGRAGRLRQRVGVAGLDGAGRAPAECLREREPEDAPSTPLNTAGTNCLLLVTTTKPKKVKLKPDALAASGHCGMGIHGLMRQPNNTRRQTW